jgi:hypothetical protein
MLRNLGAPIHCFEQVMRAIFLGSSLIGDRIQFLITMSAKVIKDVKQATLDDGTYAWQIMEEAAKEWLARRKDSKRKA